MSSRGLASSSATNSSISCGRQGITRYHPFFPKRLRRRIARALMQAIEDTARKEGRTLITLDTRTGDLAEPLYLSLGYIKAGIIPRYAIDPEGRKLEATTILYKELD